MFIRCIEKNVKKTSIIIENARKQLKAKQKIAQKSPLERTKILIMSHKLPFNKKLHPKIIPYTMEIAEVRYQTASQKNTLKTNRSLT